MVAGEVGWMICHVLAVAAVPGGVVVKAQLIARVFHQ